MTAEEISCLAVMQRSVDRLSDNLEKLDIKLDGQITATSTGFQEVKIDLASVKSRFVGGWLVVAALGAVAAVVGSWIVQLHPHITF